MVFLTRRRATFRVGVRLRRKSFVHAYLLLGQEPYSWPLAFHPTALFKEFYVLIDLNFVEVFPPILFVILVELGTVGLLRGIKMIGEVAIERGPVHLEFDQLLV